MSQKISKLNYKTIAFIIVGIFSLFLIYQFLNASDTIYLQTKNLAFQSNASVTYNKRKIGKLKEINYRADSMAILTLSVKPGIKVAAASDIQYYEDFFGHGYINFDFHNQTDNYLAAGDTVVFVNLSYKNLDSVTDGIKDVIERITNKLDSLHHKSNELSDR